MDVIEAIRARKSIRGFKPIPVPKAVLREIIEIAARAPSATNSQPWEVLVLAGGILEQIKQGNSEKWASGAMPQPEVETKLVGGIFHERRVAVAATLYGLMGINRDDKAKRGAWEERGYRFHEAPVVIIVVCDQSLSEGAARFDIGAFTQNICLAALKYGLGTCIQGQGVAYPDVIRRFTGLSESKRLVISIAIGYPDEDFPANQLVTERESVDNIITWIGIHED